MKKQPTAEQKSRYAAIVELGCAVGPNLDCRPPLTVHHCFTGAGGRKDHEKTICLCWGHHLGTRGIDGKHMSKRSWQAYYGAEQALLDKTNHLLAERK